jgi:hypothetical protein
MPQFDALVTRIRGEYREMPGLNPTMAQACRLWQLDVVTCEAVLARLVQDRFLRETRRRTYVALPSPHGQIKAALESHQTTGHLLAAVER